MPEVGESSVYVAQASPPKEAPAILQPRGEVMIGGVDPRTLSEQDFHSSPDLLFHGATEPFSFSQDYDYTKHLGPHSSTVGEGFYATPGKEDARLFSEAFGKKEEQVVLDLLPYKAKMFDFRATSDSGVNASVPKMLFDEYHTFIVNLFQQRNLTDSSSFSGLFHRNYLTMLDVYAKYQKLDLREMLSISGSQASEFAAKYFSEFMQKKGFDGIMYIEGGDHPQQHNPVSYVFYNPKKIGTFESWRHEAKG